MTNDQRISLGQRLHRLRTDRGLGLGELARRCDVSKGYLSQLERGEATNPSVEAVRKLAAGLDVPVADLLGEKPKQESGDAPPLSEGLKTFIAQRKRRGEPLTPADVTMLTTINFRGSTPKTAKDFEILYEFIKRVIE